MSSAWNHTPLATLLLEMGGNYTLPTFISYSLILAFILSNQVHIQLQTIAPSCQPCQDLCPTLAHQQGNDPGPNLAQSLLASTMNCQLTPPPLWPPSITHKKYMDVRLKKWGKSLWSIPKLWPWAVMRMAFPLLWCCMLDGSTCKFCPKSYWHPHLDYQLWIPWTLLIGLGCLWSCCQIRSLKQRKVTRSMRLVLCIDPIYNRFLGLQFSVEVVSGEICCKH